MLLFDQVEVIVHLVRVQCSGQSIEMYRQFGQVVGIIPQGAFAPAGNNDFLAEFLIKFLESCYLRASSLDKVGFFFMIMFFRGKKLII